MNFKKIIVALVLGVSVLMPSIASAALPDFNPICWKKSDCVSFRETNFDLKKKKAELGFFPQEEGCTGGEGESEWGKCSPSSKIVLQIGIGGETEITDIGDYIKKVYAYALGVAGIIAVVVIMVAGIQWMVAGGNSALISAAKKRIGGAMMGLFLAYSSYFILNSINPWLVNFRLPQTWLIKEVQMMTEFCRDISAVKEAPGVNFAPVDDDVKDEKIYELEPDDFIVKNIFIKDGAFEPIEKEKDLACGQNFAPANGGGGTCQGHFCKKPGHMCIPNYDYKKEEDKGQKPYKCEEAMMVVKAYGGFWTDPGCFVSFFVNGWKHPYFEHLELYALYDNHVKSLGGFEIMGVGSSKIVSYFKYEDKENVIDRASARGFILLGQMDEACWTGVDQLSWIGKGGVDLGMTVNITAAVETATGPSYGDNSPSPGPIPPSNVSDSQLFTLDDLEKGIYLRIDVAGIKDYD